MLSRGLALSLMVFSLPTMAAVQPNILQKTVVALRQPVDDRISALKNQGDAGFEALKQLAFDSNQALQLRWRALTMLPRVNAVKAEAPLAEAAQSSEWFMRNAALVAMEQTQRTFTLKWAEKLLDDPALVVRTAAVQTLTAIHAVEKKEILFQKLYSAENFHRGHSLWVRKHIAKALQQMASPGEEQQFAKLLKDKDNTLHPSAISALNKITGQKIESRDKWLAKLK